MKKNLIQSVVVVVILNFAVKFFGLWREILMAKYYGTGIYTDAYVIANNIPTVLYAAIGAAIAAAYVPMYARVQTEQGDGRARLFTRNLLLLALVTCFVICVASEIFANQVVFCFASGYRGETRLLTVRFTRILLLSLLPVVVTGILGAYLTIHGEFFVPSFIPLVNNLLIIVSLYFSHFLGNVYIFVIGTFLGITAQAVFTLAVMYRKRLGLGHDGERVPVLRDQYLRSLLPLVLPVFVGTAVTDLNAIVDKTLVSGLSSGSVSSLNYAYKIINLVTSVIMGAVTTTFYPEISRQAASGDREKLRVSLGTLTNATYLLMIPITCLFMTFHREIVLLLFQRGNFDACSTDMTGQMLIFYSLGLPGIAIRDIETKVFFSVQDTKTPMMNGILCALLNIILDICLIHRMGGVGAALATSLSAFFSAINLGVLLRRRNLMKAPLKNMVRVLFAAAVTYLPCWYLWISRIRMMTTGYSALGTAALMAVLSLPVYLALLYLLRVDVVRVAWDSVFSRLKG